METLKHTENYHGTEITVDAITATGFVIENEATLTTNSIRVRFDAEDETVPGIKDREMLPKFYELLNTARAAIDNVSNQKLIQDLVEAGFVLLDGLAAPGNVTAAANASTVLDVTFDAVAGATLYYLELALSESFEFIYKLHNQADNSLYQFTGLDPDTTYYVRVQAYSEEAGYSAWGFANATTDPE